MKTTVIHIKDAPLGWRTRSDFQYIGRPGHGLHGYFGNPFRLQPGETRGATIQRYREWFYVRLQSDETFRFFVKRLRGKTLVCFCKPLACHGDVIAEYLDT